MNKPVLVAAPVYWNKWLDRWFRCYFKLTYPSKGVVVATEAVRLAEEIRNKYRVQVLLINLEPYAIIDRVFHIAAAREAIRRYFVYSPYDYLLFIDSDIEYPPDTIEKMFSICGDADMCWSTKPTTIMMMNRRTAMSIRYVTAKVFDAEANIYLEENREVIHQLKHYNALCSCRVGKECFKLKEFRATWARHQDKPLGEY